MESADFRGILYTIYDKETGRIVNSGEAGNANTLNWRVKPGMGVIMDVAASGDTHKVIMAEGVPIIVERDDLESA